MEIVATNALISINATFIVQLLSFLVFLFLMNRIMFRPLRSTMQQRKEYLENVKVEIVDSEERLGQLVESIDAQRAEVVREAGEVAQDLEAEGDRQATALVEAARQEITELRQETEAKVEAQVQTVKGVLADEVEAVTVAVMEKILYRRLSS